MARAPFQVLVIPCRPTNKGDWEFAIFQRSDLGYWQGVSGGGEDAETPLDAARREAFEEAGIPTDAPYLSLDTTASIPVTHFRESSLWGEDSFVVPEYAFGVQIDAGVLTLTHEHTEMQWLPYAAADHLHHYDSNRTALWELNQRIRRLGPRA